MGLIWANVSRQKPSNSTGRKFDLLPRDLPLSFSNKQHKETIEPPLMVDTRATNYINETKMLNPEMFVDWLQSYASRTMIAWYKLRSSLRNAKM